MAILLSTNGNLEPTDNLSGNLGVTGTTNLNTLTVTGNTSINNLTVLGTTNISELVSTASTINGNLTVTGSTNVRSLTSTSSTINGNLTVTGSTNLSSLTATTVTATTLNLQTIGSGTSVTNLGVDSSGNIVSGTTQFLKFTADTSITSGYAVRLLENGRIARADFSPTGSTLPIIGIAQESGTTGSTVQVAVENEISYVQSGLLPGFNYYANTDGSLSLNGNTYMGVALSSTQLNLMFSNPAGNSIPSLSVIDNTITDPDNITAIGRYIVPSTGVTGSFVGEENDYADYDGNAFTFTLPVNGDKAVITTGPNAGNVYVFSTGSTSGWTLSSQSTTLPTSNWVSASSYKQNDLVIYQNFLYQANGDIPANTAFAVGTSGATWKPLNNGVIAEYNSVIATNGSTTSSTSFGDLPGATLTLPSAGTYRVYYNMYASGPGDGSTALFAITDSSNNIYGGSYGSCVKIFGVTLAAAGSQETTITVSAPTTIKLRWRIGGAGAGTATLISSTSSNSVFGYEKIAGFAPVVGQTTSTFNSNTYVSGATTNTFIVMGGNSGSIPYNTSTGAITLTAGNTYFLTATMALSGANNISYRWADFTTKTALTGGSLGFSDNSGASAAQVIYTPSSNQTIGLLATTVVGTISPGNYFGVSITQLGTTNTSAFTGAISPSWNISNSYPLGTMVVNNGVLYQANSFVPAGTTFTSGSSGSTWTQIGLLNGQAEYGERVMPSNVTLTNNTQVTLLTAFIPSAGVWEIEYSLNVDANGSSTNDGGSFWINDPNGNEVPNSGQIFYMTSNSNGAANLTRKITVTTTGPANYNVRGWKFSNVGATVAEILILGGGVMAGTQATLAGGRGTSKVSWNKIAGFLPASSGVPNWTSAGTIQSVGISGTTTPPTMPTTTLKNDISYKQLGPKTWEVMGTLYFTSATGAVAGGGDYVFTLPNGLQFDTTLPMQSSYQGTIQTNNNLNFINRLPDSDANYIRLSDNYLAAANPSGIIIWDATRYRVVLNNTSFANRCWGNTDFGLERPAIVYWSFSFQTP